MNSNRHFKKAFLLMANNGCDTLAYNANKILSFLKINNIERIYDSDNADLIIISTCAFHEKLAEGALKEVDYYVKRYKNRKTIIVSGCGAIIIPEIKKKGVIMVGPRELDKLEKILRSNVKIENIMPNKIPTELFKYGDEKTFFIQICEGCLGDCSYCAIKLAKGKLKSRPLQEIAKEFKNGLKEGYTKFWLVGDDCGCYGLDIGTNIGNLINKLIKEKGNYKFIINYFEPNWLVKFYPALKKAFKQHKIKFFGLPIQSGSNRILGLMNRHYKIEDIIEIIKRIKRIAPETIIQTFIIMGFPGETEEEFRKSLIAARNFDEVEVIPFSRRPGTAAMNIKGKVIIEKKMKLLKEETKNNDAKYKIYFDYINDY